MSIVLDLGEQLVLNTLKYVSILDFANMVIIALTSFANLKMLSLAALPIPYPYIYSRLK